MGIVVIAEDNRIVHRLLVRFVSQVIEPLGHKVVACWDGGEADEVIAADPSSVVLLITDISLPRIDGYELVHRSLKNKVERFIIQSASALSVGAMSALSCSLGTASLAICPKPWEVHDLQSSVRDMLEIPNS